MLISALPARALAAAGLRQGRQNLLLVDAAVRGRRTAPAYGYWATNRPGDENPRRASAIPERPFPPAPLGGAE